MELQFKRARGEIPAYARVVIETTGLADPTPIIATYLSDISLRYCYRPSLVITTVDTVHGLTTRATHGESRNQVALADRLNLTKTDLCQPGPITALCTQLAQLNYAAEVIPALAGGLDLSALLRGDVYGPGHRHDEVSRWFATHDESLRQPVHRHHSDIHGFYVVTDTALDWTAFGVWLTLLLHSHGDRVLRVKGLLNVAGVAAPVVINRVQHMVHPPVHLARWPDEDSRSRMDFIVQGLTQAAIEDR